MITLNHLLFNKKKFWNYLFCSFDGKIREIGFHWFHVIFSDNIAVGILASEGKRNKGDSLER